MKLSYTMKYRMQRMLGYLIIAALLSGLAYWITLMNVWAILLTALGYGIVIVGISVGIAMTLIIAGNLINGEYL